MKWCLRHPNWVWLASLVLWIVMANVTNLSITVGFWILWIAVTMWVLWVKGRSLAWTFIPIAAPLLTSRRKVA
jgi:hypothetical protein